MPRRIPLRLRLRHLSQLTTSSADLKSDAEHSAAIRNRDRAKSVHQCLVAARRALRARRLALTALPPRDGCDILRATRPAAESRLHRSIPVKPADADRFRGGDCRSADRHDRLRDLHDYRSCDHSDRRGCRDCCSRANRCRADRPAAKRISTAEDCARLGHCCCPDRRVHRDGVRRDVRSDRVLDHHRGHRHDRHRDHLQGD